jgi:RNA polymerase sigma-70 factor (ECF subfamily)
MKTPLWGEATNSPPHSLLPEPDAGRNHQLTNLLFAAAQGDAKSFEAFYGLTIRIATSVVYRIAGSNYTEDILSDAYFQAWQQSSQFQSERGSALAWFLAISRSRALDKLRAERLRHCGLSGAPDAGDNESVQSPLPGPDSLLESVQARGHLHCAIAKLSAPERWVLGLAYYREMNHSQIAGVTELPLGTVKSIVSRAQRKLRGAITAATHGQAVSYMA